MQVSMPQLLTACAAEDTPFRPCASPVPAHTWHQQQSIPAKSQLSSAGGTLCAKMGVMWITDAGYRHATHVVHMPESAVPPPSTTVQGPVTQL